MKRRTANSAAIDPGARIRVRGTVMFSCLSEKLDGELLERSNGNRPADRRLEPFSGMILQLEGSTEKSFGYDPMDPGAAELARYAMSKVYMSDEIDARDAVYSADSRGGWHGMVLPAERLFACAADDAGIQWFLKRSYRDGAERTPASVSNREVRHWARVELEIGPSADTALGQRMSIRAVTIYDTTGRKIGESLDLSPVPPAEWVDWPA